MRIEFAGRRVVVMGLGRFGGGIGVSRWLAKEGARVLVTDQADPASLADSVAQLEELDISFRLGSHDESDLHEADLLVVSPAVDKRRSSFVQAALRRGVPVTSEMNLFLERCPARIIGVTGTAGKSTTAAMLHAILVLAATKGELGDAAVRLGGNIGQSLLGELAEIKRGDLVVLELSSFQLEDAGPLRWSPPLALITNVLPNHLDRHGTFEEYLASKLNICCAQTAGDVILLGSHDSRLVASVGEITRQTGASALQAPEDIDGDLRVPGRHNRRNAGLAAAAAERLGAASHSIREALEGFAGLPHRLQFVRCVNGVSYFNDSKATTPGGVAVALESFEHPVILIGGGQDKGASWECVVPLNGTCIKQAICTGENRQHLARVLGGVQAASLEEAVMAARASAREGDVVLFSPGSPSYDQFVNYAARGEAFCRFVQTMS